MVPTQRRSSFIIIAALAATVACPAGIAVGGEQHDNELTVDGTVSGRLDQALVAPLGAPLPVDEVRQEFIVSLRTRELQAASPIGPAYGTADAASPVGLPFTMDHEAVTVPVANRRVVVPWYYMADDEAIRPYHALFWDTGTSWYYAYLDEAWSSFAGPWAPSPAPLLAAAGPDVRLRTTLEQIDLGAKVDVLLATALQALDQPGYARPDLPRAAQAIAGAAASPDLAQAAGSPGEALRAEAAPWQAPGSEPQAALPVQGAGLVLAPDVRPEAAVLASAAGLLAGLAAYHLIRKSAILKNKVRSAIAEHVLRQPGSTITEIAQAVGVTHQTASYHLRLLQEHGLVLGVERGNKRLYFRNDGSFNQEERGLVAVLRDPESMRVLELIRANPWIMKNEAAAALGVSRNTLNWHLQKLLDAGLVSEARENGHCFLFCNRRVTGDVLGQVAQKVEDRKGSPSGNGNGNGHALPPLDLQAPAPAVPMPPSGPHEPLGA